MVTIRSYNIMKEEYCITNISAAETASIENLNFVKTVNIFMARAGASKHLDNESFMSLYSKYIGKIIFMWILIK